MIAETLPVAMQKNSCGERLLIGLIAFCVFNLLTFFIQVLPFYYFTCIFSCGYLLLVCRQQKYTGRYFIFLLFCALSLLVHPPAPIFDAWERLILFCLVLVIASPCIYSTTLNFFRFKLQQILYCILNIIVLSSLVLYLSGAGSRQLLCRNYNSQYVAGSLQCDHHLLFLVSFNTFQSTEKAKKATHRPWFESDQCVVHVAVDGLPQRTGRDVGRHGNLFFVTIIV